MLEIGDHTLRRSLVQVDAPALRRLAELAPRTLAIMHGGAYAGDGAAMLERLARAYEQRFARTHGGDGSMTASGAPPAPGTMS